MKNKLDISMISRIFLIILLISALALLIFEIKLRKGIKYPLNAIVYDSTLGWKFASKKSYIMYDNKTGSEPFTLTFNSRGFRDSERPRADTKELKRIILLGDSYAAGVNVPDGLIFPHILKGLMNRDTDKKYDVVNAAVPGWGTDQQLLYLEEEGLNYSPLEIMLIISPNDIREAYAKKIFSLSESGELQKMPKRKVSFRQRMMWNLSTRFSLYQLLQKKFDTEYGSFRHIASLYPFTFQVADRVCTDKDIYLKEPPAEMKEAYSLFESLILRMKKDCLEKGADLVLAVMPAKMEFDGSLNETEYSRDSIEEYVRTLAFDNSIYFFDLHSVFMEEAEPEYYFLDDDFHLNRKGHVLVANRLYELYKKKEFSAPE